MTTVFLVSQFVIALIITILVLLQKTSSMGLGAYSGSNESVFGAKGPAGFLSKATFFMGTLFVVNTLALGYFYNQENQSTLMDSIESQTVIPSAPGALPGNTVAPPAPATVPDSKPQTGASPAPVAPAAPNTQSATESQVPAAPQTNPQ